MNQKPIIEWLNTLTVVGAENPLWLREAATNVCFGIRRAIQETGLHLAIKYMDDEYLPEGRHFWRSVYYLCIKYPDGQIPSSEMPALPEQLTNNSNNGFKDELGIMIPPTCEPVGNYKEKMYPKSFIDALHGMSDPTFTDRMFERWKNGKL